MALKNNLAEQLKLLRPGLGTGKLFVAGEDLAKAPFVFNGWDEVLANQLPNPRVAAD